MPKPKIDKLELNRLLRQGKTKVEAAASKSVDSRPIFVDKADCPDVRVISFS